MPGVIGALAESGTPFSILTKGTLLRRDIPCWPRPPRRGAGRARRLDGDLGRRPARRPRAGRAHAAGPARPGARRSPTPACRAASSSRPVLPGLTDDGGAAGRRHRRDRRRGRHRRHRDPAAPAPGRPRVVHGLAAARRTRNSCRATSSCTPAAPTFRPSTAPGWPSASHRCSSRHGLDRQSGGTARGAGDAVATGVPGDEEVGFPDGQPPRGRPAGRAAEERARGRRAGRRPRRRTGPSSSRCSDPSARRSSPPCESAAPGRRQCRVRLRGRGQGCPGAEHRPHHEEQPGGRQRERDDVERERAQREPVDGEHHRHVPADVPGPASRGDAGRPTPPPGRRRRCRP